MSDQTTIQCPKCATSINVNEILKKQLEDNIRKEFEVKSNQQTEEFQLQSEALSKAKLDFEKIRKSRKMNCLQND